MTPKLFQERAQRIEVSEYPGTTACDLVVDLMRTRSQWTELAVLSLLRGDQGDGVADTVSSALLHGLSLDGGMSSFVGSCFRLRRLHLLGSVAVAGIPAALEPGFVTEHMRATSVATTEAGVWLDALSAVGAVGETRSFPHAINDWAEDPAAHHCADLLLRMDPNHPHIAELRGKPLAALLNESRMRSRLNANGAERARAPDPERSVPARRAKVV